MVTRQHLGHLLLVVVGLAADETLEEGLLEPLFIKNEIPSPLFFQLPQLLRHGTSLHRLGCSRKRESTLI